MDYTTTNYELISSGLVFLFAIMWPISLAIFAAGLISATIQGVTQIRESAISMTIKLSATFVVLYLFGSSIFEKITSYSATLWGTAEYFY